MPPAMAAVELAGPNGTGDEAMAVLGAPKPAGAAAGPVGEAADGGAKPPVGGTGSRHSGGCNARSGRRTRAIYIARSSTVVLCAGRPADNPAGGA